MNRKLAIVAAGLMSIAGLAYAAGGMMSGKVMSVEGNRVTIEIDAGQAADLSVGSSVEIQVKQAKEAPKKGADALQGC